MITRRLFLQRAALASVGAAIGFAIPIPTLPLCATPEEPVYTGRGGEFSPEAELLVLDWILTPRPSTTQVVLTAL